MHIRIYIRRLKKFLQQRFKKKLSISLFVRRRLKYVHLGLHIPLLSTRLSSELIAIIKDFEKKTETQNIYLFFPN